MSQQSIDTKFLDADDDYKERLETSSNRRLYPRKRVELVGGVRVDELPTSDADTLADEGNFYPLVVGSDGCLWVRFPSGIEVETAEHEILHRIEALLERQVELLQKIAPGA